MLTALLIAVLIQKLTEEHWPSWVQLLARSSHVGVLHYGPADTVIY